MKKILFILILLLISAPPSHAGDQYNSTVNSAAASINEIEEVENQQINQDEGYGSDDQEYYEAEGINAEESHEK